MKPIPKFIWIFLLVLGAYPFSAFSIPALHVPTTNSPQKVLLDVTVGHRTNDSTGQLTISNSTIQQSIISAIAVLNSTTITSDNIGLLVFQNAAYLLFNVTDTVGVKSYVAIQLSENDSGDFIFHPGYGKELHILTRSANCTSCMYMREPEGLKIANCTADTPCKHLIHFSM